MGTGQAGRAEFHLPVMKITYRKLAINLDLTGLYLEPFFRPSKSLLPSYDTVFKSDRSIAENTPHQVEIG